MIDAYFPQVLLLLGLALAVVVLFRRLRVPSSLAYLLVGVLLGPHTAGPVVDAEPLRALAEFGIVFLLFTIGLNFSIVQLGDMRQQVVALGTAQVALTTFVVATAAWMLGLPIAAAFVVGAVFAQSSTTIISRQLLEQGDEHSRHGRLATAMSVFQDVTAVPFVVVIPALAAGAGGTALGMALGSAFVLAAIAIVAVFVVGRLLLRPLFHFVAEQRSTELFTLAVLFVSLVAAWTTNALGLSMAFGGFLVGMMLGETEFRHEVEATIRPFRDVLLGLFFVGIGMLFDIRALPAIGLHALAGAILLLGSKAVLIAWIVRRAGLESLVAWRTAWILAVGGEFGLALLAIALDAAVIESAAGQVVLASVLLSMVLGPLLIRFHERLALWCAAAGPVPVELTPPIPADLPAARSHVIICGYGRIGQSVARLLELELVPYIALDLDPTRVREAHLAGEPVFYGDAAEASRLEAVGILHARLVLISHDDVVAALRGLEIIRRLRPDLPVMVRSRDLTPEVELRNAGATAVVAETLEAGLMIAVHTLLALDVPAQSVMRHVQYQRGDRYPALRGLIRGEELFGENMAGHDADRLLPIVVTSDSSAVGQPLGAIELDGVVVTALVREGHRHLSPALDTVLEAGDVLVLFGSSDDLRAAKRRLLESATRIVPPEAR